MLVISSWWSAAKRTWFRWSHFFRPRKGWATQLKQFKAGKTAWPMPYREGAPQVVPWPVDWVPHRPAVGTDTPEEQERGFVFLECTCIDSGRHAKVGEATSCLRCGVPLHPVAANMVTSIDPPYCRRCSWVVFFTIR